MACSLVEKCEACESSQYANIIDNCDLFKGKIVALWYDFVNMSRIETPSLDMERLAPGIVESDGGLDRYVPIDSSNVNYDSPALNNVDTDFLGDLRDNKDKLSLTSNIPPSAGEVKQEMTNVEIPGTSTQVKPEPVTTEMNELENDTINYYRQIN